MLNNVVKLIDGWYVEIGTTVLIVPFECTPATRCKFSKSEVCSNHHCEFKDGSENNCHDLLPEPEQLYYKGTCGSWEETSAAGKKVIKFIPGDEFNWNLDISSDHYHSQGVFNKIAEEQKLGITSIVFYRVIGDGEEEYDEDGNKYGMPLEIVKKNFKPDIRISDIEKNLKSLNT